jgi:hypothetical protein
MRIDILGLKSIQLLIFDLIILIVKKSRIHKSHTRRTTSEGSSEESIRSGK